MDYVSLLETLVKDRSVEIADGIQLKCGEEINVSIFAKDDEVVIKFGSPAVQVHVTRMGPLRLLNIVRPTVKSLTIAKKSYRISVDNAPDIEVARESI